MSALRCVLPLLGIALSVAGLPSIQLGSEPTLPPCHNPNLKWLLFYTCLTKEVANQCDEGYDPVGQGGWCNLGFTNDTALVEKGRQYNMSSLFAVHDIFFINGQGLNPAYKEAWQKALPSILPYIKSGSITGFFIGDELISGKSVSAEDLQAVVDTLTPVKKDYPHLFLWLNEGGTAWPKKITSGKLPTELDVISIDDYALTVDEHRAFYNDTLYPMLGPKQGAFLVPASYGSHINPKENMTQYEIQMSQLALDYYAWAAEDERIWGFAPWHWDTRDPSEVSFGKEIGTADMPQLKETWTTIGKSLPNPLLV